MSRQRAATIHWLKEIGDDIPTAIEPTNLIAEPVLARKKSTPSKPYAAKSKPADTVLLENIEQASSLDELKKVLESFTGCELKKTAKNTVFGDGNPESKIMLIGEAPGAEEDQQGLPFVGASGKLLDQMMKCIGLDRTKYYITNIIPWRPPGNRNPTPDEIRLCLPFVEKRIELIKPSIIVMVGGVSAKSLLNTDVGIMRLRGQWQPYQIPSGKHSCEGLAIYHPSYLLRSPGQKRHAWQDILKLKHKLLELKLL